MKKSSESQRKSPKQGRSKALVGAIFEATVRILPTIGSRNVTTKKIADLAGVSIGSLYQYFPNKEVLLAAVMDAAVDSRVKDMLDKIDELELHGRSIQEMTDAIIEHALEMLLTNRTEVREIFLLAPELGKLPIILNSRRTIASRLARELEKQAPGHPREKYDLTAFIAVNSVMGVVFTMLYDEQQNYSTAELSKELKLTMNSYLRAVY